MAGSYIGGALFYIVRVPEVFSPGTFDIWVNIYFLSNFFFLFNHSKN
jgi:hypothetical protein